MEMKRRTILAVLIILVMLSSSSLSERRFVENREAIREAIVDSEKHMAILGSKLQSKLLTASSDETLEIIVLVDHYTTPDYISRVETLESNVNITKVWPRLGGFMAQVNPTQVISLARLSFAMRIDLNTPSVQVCMDIAREDTGVDDLQDAHSELDGDLDGNITSYSVDDVVIAIVDTGIDYTHAELDGGKVIGWKDFVGTSTIPVDQGGHGTAMASIAAASGDLIGGMARGVAPGAALVGVRVLNKTGQYEGIIIDGLEWVADNADTYGIDIVSCSFKTGQTYNTIASMADRLVKDYGLVVVAASGGNETQGDGTVHSPGTGKYVLTAGAGSKLGSYWNICTAITGFGHNPPLNDTIKPDILAPSLNVMAANITTGSISAVSGSSVACAFTAGYVALWLDYDMDLKDNDANSDYHPYVKHLIMSSAKDVPGDETDGKDNMYGAGRIAALSTYDFLTTDVSSARLGSPIVLSYTYEESYDSDNEPLWVYDETDGADYYKVQCDTDYFIYARVWGDPDLEVKVQILDWEGDLLISSYSGEDRNVGYWANYTGVYYIKVIVQDYSGDWYDIHVLLTASA
jgi:serine protease AprX